MNLISLIGSFYVALVVFAFVLQKTKPALSYWILLNMYFDPGGYLRYMFPLTGQLNQMDIIILLVLIVTYVSNFKFKPIIADPFLKTFIKALAAYLLFYLIIYGGITPALHDDFRYETFLLKNRY